MYNWKKLCSTPSGFSGLHQELRNGKGLYILDGVKMPESCGNRICTIEFRYYGENFIKLTCVEAPVSYSGSNPQIAQWLETGTAEFNSFNQLTAFLSQFGEASPEIPETPINSSNKHSQHPIPARPKIEYDRSILTVPDMQKSCIVIDKERLELDLNGEIFGQEENIKKIVHIVRNHLATKEKRRPVSVFLYGPPGTGKTSVIELLVKKLNEQLTEREQFFCKTVDCGQFQERADISKLTGAAPGYVGFDEPGTFAVLEEHPNTVFIFDEIEKAASNITETIMQAMENGRQETNGKTLRNGNTYYDLSHCIIFFTSNIVLEDKKTVGFGKDSSVPIIKASPFDTNIARSISQETKEAKAKLLKTGKFRKEVISRLSAIIEFQPLTGDMIKDIAVKSIRDAAGLHRLYITKIETPILQEFLNVTAGRTEGFGARELRQEAENFFSGAFLEYAIQHEDYAKIAVSGTLDSIEVSPG